MENTTPMTVMTAAAMAMSTWRSASALPVRIQNGQRQVMVVRRQVDLERDDEQQRPRPRSGCSGRPTASSAAPPSASSAAAAGPC